MGMTDIGRFAAPVLCAAGLALTVPDVASAAPPASSPAPVTSCVAGIHRVRVTCRHTPFETLYVVHTTWVPFATASTSPCAKGGAARPA